MAWITRCAVGKFKWTQLWCNFFHQRCQQRGQERWVSGCRSRRNYEIFLPDKNKNKNSANAYFLFFFRSGRVFCGGDRYLVYSVCRWNLHCLHQTCVRDPNLQSPLSLWSDRWVVLVLPGPDFWLTVSFSRLREVAGGRLSFTPADSCSHHLPTRRLAFRTSAWVSYFD